MGWQDKTTEAARLIEQVKDATRRGVGDGEHRLEVERKLDRARRLGEEAKAERIDELASYVGRNLSNTGAGSSLRKSLGNGSAMIALDDGATRAGDDFFAAPTRLVASEKCADALNIKSLSTRTTSVDPDAVKVLNEGTGSAGGFLVPPDYVQELFAESRRQGNSIRAAGWMNEHRVTSNVVYLPKGGGNATVGIVAENAAKPTADQTYSQVTINIFTWAGISKLSNQLLADGDPVVADVVSRELGSLLGNLEEQKIIGGSGTGEPRGILNTTGVGSVTYTDASPTGPELIPYLVDAISNVQRNYLGSPNGILMEPRTLALLWKSTNTGGDYIFTRPGEFREPGGTASFFGIPIVTTTNMPTNLGAGTNETRIIVGNWNEAHWFQRQDVTLDASNQTSDAFEKNQTWFRLEERAGFTAERYPTAFCVISGTGLIVS